MVGRLKRSVAPQSTWHQKCWKTTTMAVPLTGGVSGWSCTKWLVKLECYLKCVVQSNVLDVWKIAVLQSRPRRVIRPDLDGRGEISEIN